MTVKAEQEISELVEKIEADIISIAAKVGITIQWGEYCQPSVFPKECPYRFILQMMFSSLRSTAPRGESRTDKNYRLESFGEFNGYLLSFLSLAIFNKIEGYHNHLSRYHAKSNISKLATRLYKLKD